MLAAEIGPAFRSAGWDVVPLSRRDCDIEDAQAVARQLERQQPAVAINCAAFTHVDRAEQEPERAFAINAEGAGNVARAACEHGVPVLHLSTDYVFDGLSTRPYVETDEPAPLGAYARSKRAGEQAIEASGAAAWVVRTGELYGDAGPNFFRSILQAARAGRPLRVVDDQIVTPTWSRELANQLVALVEAALPPGVFHATCRGQTSWYDAAVFALAQAGIEAHVERVSSADYASPTPRPAFSVLEACALRKHKIYRMRAWEIALAEWLSSGPHV